MLSRKRTPAIPDLYFGNTKLAVEMELSILGVAVDRKLLWSRHISNISKNAWERLGALRKIANKLDTAGRATLYKAQFRSIMEHACLSWISASPTVLNQLDSIQQKALQIIGVNQAAACTELAIPGLQHRREVAAVTALYKMHTSHCPRDLQELLPCSYNPAEQLVPAHPCPSMPWPCLMLKRQHWTEPSFILRLGYGTTSLTRWWKKIKSDSGHSFKQRVDKHCHLLTAKRWTLMGNVSHHLTLFL